MLQAMYIILSIHNRANRRVSRSEKHPPVFMLYNARCAEDNPLTPLKPLGARLSITRNAIEFTTPGVYSRRTTNRL